MLFILDENQYDQPKKPAYYTCPCGVKLKNNKMNIINHKKTRKHEKYLKSQNEIIINNDNLFYCQCGSIVVNNPNSRSTHRRTKKHKLFLLSIND